MKLAASAARKAIDWGEAFVALNLIVKPIFDAVFNVERKTRRPLLDVLAMPVQA